jgi:single-stranded-DNA-specific exonuclease
VLDHLVWQKELSEVDIVQKYLWTYKEFDEREVDRLAAGAGISRLLAKVFVSRGVSGPEGIEYVKDFLDIDTARLHDPFLMDGMDWAVARILRAVGSRESILVYGDYDVDGVVSTSILLDFLAALGADARYFIPDRMEDGYGITMSSAVKVKELAPSVVITVDCGITSVEEVKYLMESGIDVIVTDHHECKQELPQAVAVLNPHKPGCPYPFRELSGAGVAFKLIQAICISVAGEKDRCSTTAATSSSFISPTTAPCCLSTPAAASGSFSSTVAEMSTGTPAVGADYFMKYIDLVALSTIADVVPLVGENRIIAALGLKAMKTTRNKGLDALTKVSGYGGKELSAYAVAFGIAPRVNAAGRLGSADRAVRLFTTDNLLLAEAIAKELNEENRLRQETENMILEQAVAYVEEHLDPSREKVLVVRGEGWHHGVIGIVASKITERYHRPCIIISIEEDGTGKSSARSIRNFDLFRALTACEDLLDRFGGHEMAAGLTIQGSRIDELRRRINEYADSVLADADMIPCLRIDAFVEHGDLTMESVQELDKMAPYGESNPKPGFGYKALRITDIRTMGAGRHLRLHLRDADVSYEAVGFNMGELSKRYRAGDIVDLAFSPDINEWNGTRRLQLVIKDIRPCDFA